MFLLRMLNLLELVSLKGLVSESASYEIILSHTQAPIPSDLQIRLITTALMRCKNLANQNRNVYVKKKKKKKKGSSYSLSKLSEEETADAQVFKNVHF